MATSAPRPSYSGCAARKRSTPVSFFGISDSRNEGTVRPGNPLAAAAVVSSVGAEFEEGIAVAATPGGLGPGPRARPAAAVGTLWGGAGLEEQEEEAETLRRCRGCWGASRWSRSA